MRSSPSFYRCCFQIFCSFVVVLFFFFAYRCCMASFFIGSLIGGGIEECTVGLSFGRTTEGVVIIKKRLYKKWQSYFPSGRGQSFFLFHSSNHFATSIRRRQTCCFVVNECRKKRE